MSNPYSALPPLPSNLIPYGPLTNCTLALCPIDYSIYECRPSTVASGLFIAFFSIALLLHTWLGIKYRAWFFCIAMIDGCIAEIIGYGGRIMLWQNPFSFAGFLISNREFVNGVM